MINKVLIIAEAGVNHNGDFELAKQLIAAASDSGADFVKFQTFKADRLVSKTAKKSDYQIRNTNDNNSQFEMLKKLEMPEQWHYDLISYADSLGIKFLSTGFDLDSIDFLDRIGIPFFKIPSGEITNRPFLEYVARKGKPVIISSGMANMEEINDALQIMLSEGISRESITVLHCNTDYPTPMEDVNLLAMITIEKELGVSIGYSDHTEGIEVPIAAVALGAKVIEKHFTLDRNMPGPDHRASLEPDELKSMVKAIRNIELAISGDGQKRPSPSESKNMISARKSIFLAQPLSEGDIIKELDLVTKRPGDGINPMQIPVVIGKKLKTDLSEGHKLEWSDLI
jgi:N,N'-diacetyllegionaminate synthase